jgi:hypothetical protein
MPKDKELGVLLKCLRLLESLEPAERERVLTYLVQRDRRAQAPREVAGEGKA